MFLRYLVARWRHRGSPSSRFIRSGLGLERRSQELSAFWSDHFSRSRAAQTRWAQSCEGDVLTVLGAGPLRDFNSHSLARSFKRFRLVDANPLSPSYWSSLSTPVEPVITDISCCMDAWAEAIRRFKGTWPETLVFISDLGAAPISAYAAPTEGLLSLNVLSQLEVGWQEMVEPLLYKHFGRSFVLTHEQEWLNAIRPTAQALVEQHLIALEASTAKSILLITDVEFVEYTGRNYQRNRLEPPPMEWSEAGWRVDPGISYEAIKALEGVTLDRPTLARLMPSYELEWQDSWLWHISPNGTEPTSYGQLHRVIALALRRH